MRKMPVKVNKSHGVGDAGYGAGKTPRFCSGQAECRTILTCLFFLVASLGYSFAAPCYGTRMPVKNKFIAGLQNYTIFKRYLENSMGKVRSVQYFFQLSYGVLNWLSIDLKIGPGNIKQNPPGSAELHYPTNFAGGYGLRVKLLDGEKVKSVLGFQHISVHPKSIHLGNDKNQAILDDWQFSLLASYGFKKFTPYIGTRWSRVDYIHWNAGDRKRVMSDLTKSVGLICGADIAFNKETWLNIEGQFLDSEALAVSLNFSF